MTRPRIVAVALAVAALLGLLAAAFEAGRRRQGEVTTAAQLEAQAVVEEKNEAVRVEVKRKVAAKVKRIEAARDEQLAREPSDAEVDAFIARSLALP